jgi:phosphopantothenoylcysteine decarboxylase/phosphopantothenate--cysteine ligase
MSRAKKLSSILVTAGPTRERIDSVRYISNFSTGNMGYELAKVSIEKGYKVTLISGPTALGKPGGARFISVEDTSQMEKAVRDNIENADCLFMASAVCDWRPIKRRSGKIKKAGKDRMTIDMVPNPDILRSVGRKKKGKLIAGFALEADSAVEKAKAKLKDKHLDLVVANSVKGRTPFGAGNTDVTIMDKRGRTEKIVNASKKKVAARILRSAEKIWREGR